MGTSAVFGIETPDVDADLDTWGDIEGDYKDALEAKFGPVLISSGTPSAAATVDIEMPAGYRLYKLLVTELEPATNAASLYCRFSVDSGVSYLATADYTYAGVVGLSNGSAASQQSGASAVDQIALSGPILNTAGVNTYFDLDIINPSGNTHNTRVNWAAGYSASTGVDHSINAFGRVIDTNRTTHIRLLMSSGNITAARWALYGLRGL